MRDHVGVVHAISANKELKKQALLFDKIAVIDLQNQISKHDITRNPIGDDLRWLEEQGFLFEPAIPNQILGQHACEYERNLNHLHSPCQSFFAAPITKVGVVNPGDHGYDQITDVFKFKSQITEYKVRVASLALSAQADKHACPIVPAFSHELPLISEMKKSIAVNVVLNQFPLPDESASWQDIIEFKADQNTRHKLVELRHWISKVTRENLSASEVTDEIEHLFNQFERHMHNYKMKVRRGIVETIVVSTLETIENLAKFHWGNMAKNLFSLNKAQLALLEEESKAPGQEVAFISDVRQKW